MQENAPNLVIRLAELVKGLWLSRQQKYMKQVFTKKLSL
jgi:hypothetical protein